MKELYLWLDVGSLAIPFLFSFHPKLQFYKKWRSLFPAILIMMLIFIPWDVYFTYREVWGFNEEYITGMRLFQLPVEEWLFFICIPYACLFTHYSLQYFFPKLSFTENITSYLYVALVSVLVVLLLYFYDRMYTAVNFAYTLFLLGWVYNYRREYLQRFLPTFLIILIPFFFINGVLTGTGLAEPVVWYNNVETLEIRLGTIPVEDTMYALSMLLTVFLFTETLERRYGKR